MKTVLLLTAFLCIGSCFANASEPQLKKEVFYGTKAVPNDINPCTGKLKYVCAIKYYKIEKEQGEGEFYPAEASTYSSAGQGVVITETTTDADGNVFKVNEYWYDGDVESASQMLLDNKAPNSVFEY